MIKYELTWYQKLLTWGVAQGSDVGTEYSVWSTRRSHEISADCSGQQQTGRFGRVYTQVGETTPRQGWTAQVLKSYGKGKAG
jgi:hypothetical protein